jgi:putative membrane protein
MMFDYGDHMSGWGWAFMGLSMLLFWGLLIAGIVVLVRYLGGTGQDRPVGPPHRPTPEEVLADRFARGEIDEPEYRQRLETLRTGAQPPAGS